MALNVVHNSAASVASRYLEISDRNATRSITRLAAGMRVVTARDDAASLAIGSRLGVEVNALRQSAENAFLEEEIFNTRHRTGIMIFISFFEHEVIVMADRGISKVVEQQEWDKIVADLVSHIRAGNIVGGLEAGIKRCGEILLEKGFKKSDDDVNELRDDLRLN